MKSKRRYETAQQIMADIDRYQARAKKQLEDANAVEAEGHEMLRKSGLPEFKENELALDFYGKEALKRAETMRSGATNILNGKLKKLKEKLAEFQTQTMPFMDDKSIPV